MKQLFALGGWVFLAAVPYCICMYSQEPKPGSPLSARELAHRVDQHYNQLHSVRCSFQESYEGLGMRRTESGTLLLLKPGRMKWEYTQPAGKIFLIDGQYAWFYAKGDPQAQRFPAKKLDDLRSPLRFLLGHTELEKELNGLTAAPAGKDRYVLSGVPRGQEQRVRHLALTVNLSGSIQGIEIEEMDGATTRFLFSNEQPNAALPVVAFRFTPPAGVPVVEAMPPM